MTRHHSDVILPQMIDELEPFGCRELHVVKGKVPNGIWQLPVFVDFFRSQAKEYARVSPAVGLNAEQAQWLAYAFSLHNIWKRRDVFLLERLFLAQLTERVQGITPEYYFLWPGCSLPLAKIHRRLRIAKDDINDDEISEDTEDFIEFIHKRRAVDKNVLRLAIDLISREAPYWLTQKKRAIDLGFVRLFAFPYRVNWKEILLAKFRDIAWVFSSNKETRDEALLKSKFNEHLCRLEMISIDRYKRHVHWTLEAVPTDQWERDAGEIEMTKQAGGETSYIRLYEKLVATLAPRILEVFTGYVQKVARPFGQIVSSGKMGAQKLVPYRGPKEMLPKIGGNIPVHITIEDKPQRFGRREKDVAVLVRPETLSVQTMPCVPQTDAQLRESNVDGNVDQSQDGNDGTNRVPMSLTDQTKNSGSKLLVIRPKPGDEPLAEGT